MSRFKDQVTSTEKLLELIRNRENEASSQLQGQVLFRPSHSSRFNHIKLFRYSNIPTVGIDVGRECIWMVKTVRMSDGQWRLLDKKSVNLPKNISRKDPEFAEFLKNELTRFLGSSKKVNLWTNIPASGVDVRYIRIPKVSKKQIKNAAYWTVRKEVPFDEKEYIFDYELREEVIEQGVPKWSVMVYLVPRSEVENIKTLFLRSGFSLAGVSITPFALQNLFRTKWWPSSDVPMASLLIGNDYSRIDIFCQGKLVMTRGIKAGSRSMLDSLQENLSDYLGKHSANKESLRSLTREEAGNLLTSASPEICLDESSQTPLLPNASEIFDMVLPAINRLVQQVERTFEYFAVNSNYGKVESLYISSALSLYRPLADYIGSQLGIEHGIFDPLGQKMPQGLLDNETDQPSKRLAFIPCLALALSDSGHTQNFIFTSSDRMEQSRVNIMNRAILLSFAGLCFLCAILFIYQGHQLKIRITEKNRLAGELARFNPRFSQVDVMRMAAILKSRHINNDRYLGMAVINELSGLTPTHIKLLTVKANLTEASNKKKVETKPTSSASEKMENSKQVHQLEIEGVVNAERKMLESLLAQYVMKLNASPLFGEVVVQKNEIENLGKRETLHFTLNAKIT